MRIGVFGKLRETFCDGLEVAMEPGESVAALRARLVRLHPAAERDLLGPRARVCVDDRVVDEDFRLAGHERVEFLPPLSGG